MNSRYAELNGVYYSVHIIGINKKLKEIIYELSET